MSTFARLPFRCQVCGQTSNQEVLFGTSTFGSVDLDLRPPRLKRYTMDCWVQTCPHCGYCFEDISQSVKGTAALVESRGYRAQLNDPDYPGLANQFLCCSLVHEHFSGVVRAGWNSLSAAWVCDDAGAQKAARRCRLRAAALFRRAIRGHIRFTEDLGGEYAILTDVLRRAGRMEEAGVACRQGLTQELDEIIRQMLEYQRLLIADGDIRCHTVAEVPEGESAPEPDQISLGERLHTAFVKPHCPYCGRPLRTSRAKQCRYCGRDWHDPGHVSYLKRNQIG